MSTHFRDNRPAPHRVTQRRSISHPEQALVRWLLEHAATIQVTASWYDQIPHLKIVDACPCGCPSVDFIPGGQSTVARIVADAFGTSPEGGAVGVLLWAQDDALSGLEVYSVDGGENRSLPMPLGLRPTFGGAG